MVFDEAHELEDIASAAFGFEIGAGRFGALARTTRPLLDDESATAAVDEAGLLLDRRPPPATGAPSCRARSTTRPRNAWWWPASACSDSWRMCAGPSGRATTQARAGSTASTPPVPTGAAGSSSAGPAVGQPPAGATWTRSSSCPHSQVAWVEGPDHAPLLRVAPLDVGASFEERLWGREDAPTAVLTSATIPPRLGERLGLAPGSFDVLDVGSPFAYDEQALLYCPLHLPDPRHPAYEAAMHDELAALIDAAEGRTLALFTSWRAMTAAAEALRPRVRWPVLTQSDLPKPALVARFSADEHSCLFATMGFWQGVDVPGPALSVVAIDRLPFPRPDDPLLQARRANLGRDAFDLIDVPRAATLLAQGTGRLIRSRSDRGVVAVLDSRLGTARYRWDLIRALPPMRRTRHRADVEAFLAPLRTSPAAD